MNPDRLARSAPHDHPRRDRPVRGPSDRSFGLTFFVVLALVGLWPVPYGGGPRWWVLVVAAGFLLAALLRPRVLAPLNRVWLRLGRVLNRLVSPFILGLVFYLAVTPTGLVMRLLGKRPIDPRPDPERDSYWVGRHPPGPGPDTMTRQF